MESIPVCGGLVDIQLTQADSHGDCLSIPLFNCTPSAHLIKLPIKSIKQVSKLTTQTLGRVWKVNQIHRSTDGRTGYLRELTQFLPWSKVSAMAVHTFSPVVETGGLCVYWTHHNYESSKYSSGYWCVSGTFPDPWPQNHSFPRIPQLSIWKP